MMYSYAIAAAALASASAMTVTPEIVTQFGDFMTKFGKEYEGEEFAKRVQIFADNLEKTLTKNKEHILAGGEQVFGVTKFMDMTPEEFKATYLTYKPIAHEGERVTFNNTMISGSIDWRTKGAVTAVRDQGQCGSCWAFSTAEAIESYSFLNGGVLQELSPQQINSCDRVDQGCNGGNTESAYQYVMSAGGIQTEASYPYRSGGGLTGQCEFEKADVAVQISGYKSVARGEDNLKSALNDGPVSVCLAAAAFQTYSSGILSQCDNQVDHCVQAVGYDDTGPIAYWIVRNSWNTDWGEDGYIRIAQGKDLCRIADDATFPTFD